MKTVIMVWLSLNALSLLALIIANLRGDND